MTQFTNLDKPVIGEGEDQINAITRDLRSAMFRVNKQQKWKACWQNLRATEKIKEALFWLEDGELSGVHGIDGTTK